MPTSLFIEHHTNGFAFYINGDLQFDTADEALYHEYLVIPAVALAVGRFPDTGLRVLICGGGDGLAARDVLRFPEVHYIDLVDYNPDVLELAQTVFKPFNQGSLESDRLTVYAQEAFEFILRCFECDREIIQDRNVGAAAVEAGNHIANGLILSAALAGDSGGWLVALVCWLIGLGVLVLVSIVYPRVAKYDVFGEIQKRNNPAAGVALAGLLIATGNIVRVAFTPEFQNWLVSFTQYGLILVFSLVSLIVIRWVADLILVPGVKISDEIVNQEIPNLGAGLIEAFAYIAASFLIAWCFS